MKLPELEEPPKKRVVAWMASNSIVSNMLMFFLLIGGYLIARDTKQEIWPNLVSPTVQVSVAYPGASPDEVEQEILLALETSLQGIAGVSEIYTYAYDGLGLIKMELLATTNPFEVFQDVQSSISSISTFPEQAEPPEIKINDSAEKILTLLVYGKQSYATLKELAERIQDGLQAFSGIGSVRIGDIPEEEISIEVPFEKLRAHNLTLDKIASVIRESSVNLPGGEILTETGRVLVRTRERRLYGREFLNLPITTTPSGVLVTLGDIATVRDELVERDKEIKLDGLTAIPIDIYSNQSINPKSIIPNVYKYIDKIRENLPPNIRLKIWDDSSTQFSDRVELLKRDAIIGLVLIVILLGLFLEIRVAFWVTLCIPVSMLGAFIFTPFIDFSINMISLFGFIVALGIVVDYSVVMGESVYRKREEGLDFLEAAQEGAALVTRPILFAICTNIIAFLPLLFIPGNTGKVIAQIPLIAIFAITVSMIECLFILPSHLSLRPNHYRIFDLLNRPKIFLDTQLKNYIAHVQIPMINMILGARHLVLAIAITLLAIFIGLMLRGYFTFSLFPRSESNTITAHIELPFGAPIEEAQNVREIVTKAANLTASEIGQNILDGIYSQIGVPIFDSGLINAGSHTIAVSIALKSSALKEITIDDFTNKLREKIGTPLAVKRIHYSFIKNHLPKPQIEIALSHPSRDTLVMAAKDLFKAFSYINGVIEQDSGIPQGKRRLDLSLSPNSQSLGITAENLGKQIRSAFYGTQAVRLQRGRSKVKVMLRLPKKERSSLDTLKKLTIRTPNGGEMPLSLAATISENTSYASTQRRAGKPTLNVSANVDESKSNLNHIIDTIKTHHMPELIKRYPGLIFSLEGNNEAVGQTLSTLINGFIIALLVIYTILAIAFRSYSQPFIILICVPFGIIGALTGHLILGYECNLSSLFGIIALSGVLVNNSLIIVDTMNKLREGGFSTLAAVRQAGIIRFRPVMLSALTTFFGVLPLIFENSYQSKAIVPMGISLGFGVLFATFISFSLVPALYLLLEGKNRANFRT